MTQRQKKRAVQSKTKPRTAPPTLSRVWLIVDPHTNVIINGIWSKSVALQACWEGEVVLGPYIAGPRFTRTVGKKRKA